MILGELINKNARCFSDKTALIFGTNRFTYKQLQDRVNQLCNAIFSLGLKKGDRLALLSRNCHQYIEFVYACAKTGVIAQPLNWRFSSNELTAAIRDVSPRIVIIDSQFADRCQSIRASNDVEKIIGLNEGHNFEYDYEDLISQQSNEELFRSQIQEDDVYAIISTGGVTGTPKGVMITHKNAITQCINALVVDRPRTDDIYMVLPTLFHNPHAYIHPYFLVGATIVVMDFSRGFDPTLVLSTIQGEKVTAFLAVATMLNYVIDTPNFKEYDVSSVRLVSYGGGPMSPATLRRSLDAFGCSFAQWMGQTECSPLISYLSIEDHKLGDSKEKERRLASCGKEVPCTYVRVVNQNGNDVTQNGKEVGEIIAKGANVMKGYWRREELTSNTIKNGWCYTGDMATVDSDGYIYVVDRKKDMIISGGENIFSKVVEDAICEHHAVKDVAVIGVPDKKWGETVKAIVVLNKGMTATEEDIINECKKHVASYMKPTSVEFVDQLPKNSSGKTLKRELRDKYWKGKERKIGEV